MAVVRFVKFCVKKAQLLADITGVEADLRATEDICRLLIEKKLEFEPDEPLLGTTLKEALCSAALIRYGRSFNSGIRAKIPEDIIASLPVEQQEAHQYFENLRNKWIAHSVNDFEENTVVAYLTPEERGPRKISQICVQHAHVTCLGGQDILRLKNLAAEVRERIAVIIKSENQKVLKYAQSLPVDQFYVQKDSFKAPGKDAKKPRKKY
jgi:hypothetical protein